MTLVSQLHGHDREERRLQAHGMRTLQAPVLLDLYAPVEEAQSNLVQMEGVLVAICSGAIFSALRVKAQRQLQLVLEMG